MSLINRVAGDGDLRPEDPALCAIGRDAVDGRQRIRGDHRAPPSDHVTVVVVVRWLDQNKLESFGGHGDIQINVVRRSCAWKRRSSATSPRRGVKHQPAQFRGKVAREQIHGFSIHASSATRTVTMKAPTTTTAAMAPKRPSHPSDIPATMAFHMLPSG